MADQEQIIRQLSDELADMKRRLSALETAPRANQTAVRNGYTRWFVGNTAELPVAHAGMDSGADDVGFWVTTASGDQSYFGTDEAGTDVQLGVVGDDPDLYVTGSVSATAIVQAPAVNMVVTPDPTSGFLLRIVANRMYAPLIATAWMPDPFATRDGFGRPQSSSGTYTTLWRTWLAITADRVATNIYVDLDVGVTSVDVRISARIANTATAFTTVATYAGLTADGYLTTPIWTVPTSISGDSVVIGRMLEFIVETRVVGGAGNVQIGAWAPLTNWPS